MLLIPISDVNKHLQNHVFLQIAFSFLYHHTMDNEKHKGLKLLSMQDFGPTIFRVLLPNVHSSIYLFLLSENFYIHLTINLQSRCSFLFGMRIWRLDDWQDHSIHAVRGDLNISQVIE